LLTAFFASAGLGGLGLPEGTGIAQQFGVQLLGVAAVLIWSVAISYIVIKVVDATIGLRVDEEDEIEGLDLVAHGERGYDL
jgi:Amt family ammonium transporter